MTEQSWWPIDWTLAGTTNLGKREPRRKSNKVELHIPQNFGAVH